MTAVVWIPEVGWESCLNGRFMTARPAGNNTELSRTEIPHPAWLGLRGFGQTSYSWKRRRSSAVAISGERPRQPAMCFTGQM